MDANADQYDGEQQRTETITAGEGRGLPGRAAGVLQAETRGSRPENRERAAVGKTRVFMSDLHLTPSSLVLALDLANFLPSPTPHFLPSNIRELGWMPLNGDMTASLCTCWGQRP